MLCADLPCLKELRFAGSMANISDRWYFTKEKIRNSPSVQDGIEHAKELGYRQQCANLIQDIGQRLQIMAACFLFLAAKVEEQPRKLEHILKASHICLHSKDDPSLDPKSDEYMQLSTELVNNESVLLQTLGFEVSVDHPNTFVVKCAQLVKASKELAQTAYFLATNSLHLTTFCIQYKPTLVACVCIYVSCLWANFEIPETESKNWYEFIDNTATKKQLEDLSSYFIKILDSCPTRLKKKLTSGAVVYKDGKVTTKKETSNKQNIQSEKTYNTASEKANNKHDFTHAPSTSSNHTNNSKEGTPKPSHTKSHLTGLLKAHSHEATPPPSSRPSNIHNSSHLHSSHSKKPFENNHKRTSVPLSSHSQDHRKVVLTSTDGKPHSKSTGDLQNNKTVEHLKVEQRKHFTPQQWEEYRKRKEKEKLYLQRKRTIESNAQAVGNGKDNNFKHPESVRNPSLSSESPVKRQKLDQEHSIKTDNYHNHTEYRNKSKSSILSSSGSDSDSSSNSLKLKNNVISGLPPPPPPPSSNSTHCNSIDYRNDVKLKPSIFTKQKLSPPPPPPPPIDPQHY